MRPEKELCVAMGNPELSLLDQCKQLAADIIQQESERLHSLSQDIWSKPELAYQEHQAHDTMTHFFSSYPAWEVQPHYKLDTAFKASWVPVPGAEGPPILHVAFLCEYDALPGLGHACGHNLIAEVGAAAALGLKGALENIQLLRPVQITVFGTPAEEEGGGKIDLLEAGAFDDIDVVFMAHPSQEDAAYLPDVAEHE
ncbi:peptidase M20 domain-containing protein 2-like [Bombina bombina]|uniref:peptidase M20 domain-containing protein 2-like n=1 Tax=Bombina bombina TaxID=8345 RepID=UPI00235AC7C4|nr:peptidase M20 domain-containing protein 2-like [Bombina bombina]